MAGRGGAGGILGLLELIEEHRAALRYDWRTRFGMGLDESVPDVIGWAEALDLVRVLSGDPSSQIAAAMLGLDYPLDRTGWILSDLMDLQGGKAMGKKWKSYQRPSKPANLTERYGNAKGQAPEQVKERLRLARLGEALPPI